MKRIAIFLIVLSLLLIACKSRPKTAVPTPTPPLQATAVPTAAPPPANGSIQPLPDGGARLATQDGLKLTLDSAGQVVALTIDGEELPITPALPLVVRDLSHAGDSGAPNLLPNPGFEEGQSGWSSYAASRVDVSVTSSTAHSGGSALEIRSKEEGGRGAVISDPIPVTPGAPYRLSGHFQVEFGYVDAAGTPIFWQDELYDSQRMVSGLYVQWLDAAGAPLHDTPQLAVALHWNAQTWHKISRELTAPPEAAAVQLIAGAKPVTGAVWIDDLAWTAADEPDEPLAGTLEIGSDSVTQRGEVAGLQTAVTYRPYDDHIAITITLTDPNDQTRAFDAAWGLPLAADGWTWHDDLRHSRPITPGSEYANAVSATVTGYLPVSRYPYAALEDGAHGLALAQPVTSPRYLLLRYDGENGRYEGRAHLGISPAAVKLGSSADFSLHLYRTNPDWGLRAAADRHAALNPAAYERRGDFTTYSAFTRETFRATGERAEWLRQYNEANVYAAQYTVYELPIRLADGDAPTPSFADALAKLDSDTVICDAAGEPHLKSIGVHPWSDNQWEATWIPNVDPDLPGGAGGAKLVSLEKLFADTHEAGLRLDGVFIDNFISTSAIDTCPAHLAAADLPLTYDPNSYQPGIHTASAGWEFIVALRALLDGQPEPYRGIGVNFWSLNTAAQLMPYIDAFAGEGTSVERSNWSPDVLDYRMAVAMSRPRLFANQQPDLTLAQIETYAHEALFYGIRPTRGENGGGWPDGYEAVLEWAQAQVKPLMQQGWQPITHAVTDHPDVWVERFGDSFFTVHNWGETAADFTLTIDAPALGLDAASLTVMETTSGTAVPVTLTPDGKLQLSGRLDGGRTAVYQIR